jgi:SAM-dependent methyltransferase
MFLKGNLMNQIEYNGRDNLDVMQEAKNYNRYLFDLILSSGRATNDSLLVDFGAGSGTFAIPVKAAGCRVICVETDPVLFANLAKRGLDVVSSLELIEDGSIDYLYSLNVLEHIEDDEAITQLWFQKLCPGGQLLVYVPAFQMLYSSMDRKVGHFRRYTKHKLIERLTHAGFEISEARYADSVGFLATLIFKVLDKGQGDVDLRMLRIYDRWVFPLSRLIDCVTYLFFGKNVYVRASKPLI